MLIQVRNLTKLDNTGSMPLKCIKLHKLAANMFIRIYLKCINDVRVGRIVGIYQT